MKDVLSQGRVDGQRIGQSIRGRSVNSIYLLLSRSLPIHYIFEFLVVVFLHNYRFSQLVEPDHLGNAPGDIGLRRRRRLSGDSGLLPGRHARQYVGVGVVGVLAHLVVPAHVLGMADYEEYLFMQHLPTSVSILFMIQ